ncbi:PAS domain S-box protein [Ktedonobacter racemifer]|nr:PAS domain S-box protein [Ktedonobacter racemifer]
MSSKKSLQSKGEEGKDSSNLTDAERLRVLAKSKLLDSASEEVYDRFTKLAAMLLNSPVSLVSLVDKDRQYFKSYYGLPEPWASQQQMPLSHSFCQYVVSSNQPLIVTDAREKAFLEHNLAIPDVGTIAYLGFPLVVENQALGSFCVIDTKPHAWSEREIGIVRELASFVTTEIALRIEIAEHQQVTERLQESEQNFRVLSETVPQLVWTMFPNGRRDYVNQRWCDYTGSTRERMQSDRWAHFQFIHPDDREGNRAFWQHALQTGEPFESEHRLRNGHTGTYRWFLARAMPVRNETGEIVKWFGTATDIDEQKRAEQQLKESEENWRVLAETMPQLVWSTGPDGVHEYTNQRWRDYTGLTPEQVQNNRWAHLQLIHPDDREGTRALWQHALDTGAMYEHEERLSNGQTGAYRWFLVRAMSIRDEAGQIVKWFGTCTDIDDQKRMQEALRESQERASVLMNSNIIGIFVEEGEQIVDANDTFLRMTGYTREDLRAGRINWRHMTPPEYLARTQQAHQELATQQSMTPYEKEYVCQDGSRLPVLVGGIVFQHHPLQAITFVLDNSARKELEQRKDDFISMASHELRGPLTALKLQTTLLRRQLAKQGTQASAPALSSMETQINKVTRLVEELLDVSKIQAGRLEYVQETVDLDALLREITETLQQSSPSHTLVVRGTGGTGLIGDRDRLGQVFTNLISNAIKYSPNAETVEMDLSASEDAVTVCVCDHGLGIPREQRDKIFERFYRVSGPNQKAIPGLGMGLYIVAEIVRHHGGSITVESEVGKGSTFQVTLPMKRV